MFELALAKALGDRSRYVLVQSHSFLSTLIFLSILYLDVSAFFESLLIFCHVSLDFGEHFSACAISIECFVSRRNWLVFFMAT